MQLSVLTRHTSLLGFIYCAHRSKVCPMSSNMQIDSRALMTLAQCVQTDPANKRPSRFTMSQPTDCSTVRPSNKLKHEQSCAIRCTQLSSCESSAIARLLLLMQMLLLLLEVELNGQSEAQTTAPTEPSEKHTRHEQDQRCSFNSTNSTTLALGDN